MNGTRRPNLKAGDSNYDYKTGSPTKFVITLLEPIKKLLKKRNC